MFFFVNSAKFLIKAFLKKSLDGSFCINTRSVYFLSTTLCLFKNVVTHIFRLSIFSAFFVDWEQERTQYFKPLARSHFSTQSNIHDGDFFAKIVDRKIFSQRNSIADTRPGSKYASVSSHEKVQ